MSSVRQTGVTRPVDLESLHRRLASCAGDEQVIDEVSMVLDAILRPRLRRWFPVEHPHDVDTAVNDAILKYLTRPELFHPEGAPLDRWLGIVAANQVRNLRRDRMTRLRHEANAMAELGRLSGARPKSVEPDVADCRRRILSVARTLEEEAFLDARLSDAPIEEQARAAGGQDADVARQRRLVNRAMNKLHQRGRRQRPSGGRGPAGG